MMCRWRVARTRSALAFKSIEKADISAQCGYKQHWIFPAQIQFPAAHFLNKISRDVEAPFPKTIPGTTTLLFGKFTDPVFATIESQ
jgi:hypothetical protein